MRAADAFVRVAEEATSLGWTDIALEVLGQGAERFADDLPTSLLRATLLLQTGDVAGAEDVLLRAADGAPNDAAVQVAVADWYLERRMSDQAALFYTRAVALSNAPARAFLEQARILASGKDFPAMERALREYMRRANGDVQAALDAGALALEEGSFQVGVDLLAPVFDASPQHRELAQLLAEAYDGVALEAKEHEVYARWADAQPDRGEALVILGQMYGQRGDLARAKKFFEQAFDDPKVGAQARFELADVLYRTGAPKDAIVLFDTFVALSADKAKAREDLFNHFRYLLKDPEQAERVAREALAADPRETKLAFELGSLFLEVEKRDRASEAFHHYVARSDDPVAAARAVVREAHRWREVAFGTGFAREERDLHPGQGQYEAVIGEALDLHAITIEPDDRPYAAALQAQADRARARFVASATAADRDGLIAFANEMLLRKSFKLAAEALDIVGLEQIRDPSLLLGYADALIRVGRTDEAVRRFDAYVERSSHRNEARLLAARRLVDAGYPQDAAKHLKDILAEERTELGRQAFQILVEILVASGRREALRSAVSDYLEVTRLPFEATGVAAAAFARAGMSDDALRAYESMLSLRPAALDVVIGIAALTLVDRNPETGYAALEGFASSSPTPLSVWLVIADYYAVRGETARALAAYERVITGAERPDPEVLTAIGELHLMRGEIDAADAVFARALNSDGDPSTKLGRMVTAYRRAGKWSKADEIAALAVERVEQPGPFLLMRIEHALAAGRPAVAMQWADAYLAAQNPPHTLVQLMTEEGSLANAEEVIDFEVQRNLLKPAVVHTVALAPRAILHMGLPRWLASLRSFGEGVRQPAALSRTAAKALFEAGDYEQALVVLGELGLTIESRPADRQMRARVWLALGNDAAAIEELEATLSGGRGADLDAFSREAAAILLDAGRSAAGLGLLRRGWESGQLGLLPDLVGAMAAQARTDEAFDLMRDAMVALDAAPEGWVSVAMAGRRLAQLGWHAEVADIYRAHEEARGSVPEVALAYLEAVALSGDEAAITEAVEAVDATFATARARQRLRESLVALAPSAARAGIVEALESRDEMVARDALHLATVLAASPEELDAWVARYVDARYHKLRAYLEAGAALSSAGRHVAAVRALRMAAEIAPIEASVHQALADAAYLAGDFKTAKEEVRATAQRRPDRAQSLADAALRFASGPDAGIAADALEQVLAVAPSDQRALLALAHQAYLAGELERGDSWAAKYLAQADVAVVAQGQLIGVLLDANSVDRAVTYAEAIVAAEEASDDALWRAGLAFVRAERDADAVVAFERAVAASLGPLEMMVSAAEVFRAVGRLNQAEQFLEKAIAREPESPAPRLYRGLMRLQNGDVEGAMLEFDAATAHGYRPVETRRIAATALLDAGAEPEAARLMTDLANATALPAGERVVAILAVYSDHGRAADGIALVVEHMGSVVSHLHDRPIAAAAMVRALLQVGRVDDARHLAERTAHTNQDTPEGWGALAAAQVASEDLAAARRSARNAALKASDEERGAYLALLGEVEQAAGNNDEARAAMWSALRATGDANARWVVETSQRLAKLEKAAGNADNAAQLTRRAERVSARLMEPKAFR